MLSRVPEPSTLAFAETHLENLRNPPEIPPTLTWKDILEGDPFEGQHWQGAYGLPPGSTVENWETHSDGSTPSLSSLDDSDDLDDSRSLPSPPPTEHLDHIDATEPSTRVPFVAPREVQRNHAHRSEFEEFQARQYWREGWHSDADVARPFDIRDASTLGEFVFDLLKGADREQWNRSRIPTDCSGDFTHVRSYTSTRGIDLVLDESGDLTYLKRNILMK